MPIRNRFIQNCVRSNSNIIPKNNIIQNFASCCAIYAVSYNFPSGGNTNACVKYSIITYTISTSHYNRTWMRYNYAIS